MNLPFIKPVYDSLLRGKNLVLSADLSFLSKTISYENTFYPTPEIRIHGVENVECSSFSSINLPNYARTPNSVAEGVSENLAAQSVGVIIENVAKNTYESSNSNICHFNPFVVPEFARTPKQVVPPCVGVRVIPEEDLSSKVIIEDGTRKDEDEEYIPFVLKTIHQQTDTHETDTLVNTTPEPTKQMPCPTTIRHLVISGGGEMGFSFYSALRESNKSGFWDIKNIESIYSTSVGSIFAIPMALLPHFGWDIYDDFVLKRPWHKVFDVHFGNFANSFHKKGVFTKETMHEIFKPIFNAIDLPMNITLKEFYEYTHIDLHIMTTELTQFELIDLSYKTHPDWELLDAVYCSSCLPILFAPHYLEDRIYLDGGFISNYPINRCLEQVENPDEILGFKRKYQKTDDTAMPKINTLFDYLFYIMYTMFTKVSDLPKSIKNQVEVYNYSPTINFYKMYNTFKSYDERVILLDDGIRSWEEFYKNTYMNISTTSEDGNNLRG
jgi:predicted acylesterase/phospholipase RssA